MFYVSHRNNKYVSHCCNASVCLPDHSCGHVEILSTSRVKCWGRGCALLFVEMKAYLVWLRISNLLRQSHKDEWSECSISSRREFADCSKLPRTTKAPGSQLTNPLISRFNDWSIARLTAWSVDWLIAWFIDWRDIHAIRTISHSMSTSGIFPALPRLQVADWLID